jgi:hypothetical protein
MRDHVRFHADKEFVGTEENGEAGVLSVDGAGWFLELLAVVQGLAVEPRLCQEDWGVVIFAERDGKRFWIGLTWWPEGEGEWLVHVHHDSFALRQRLSRTGKEALVRLIADLDNALRWAPGVSGVVLSEERDLR